MEKSCNGSSCGSGNSCGSDYPAGFTPNEFVFDERLNQSNTMNEKKVSSVKVVSIHRDPKTNLTVIEFNSKVDPFVILKTVTGIGRRFVVYSPAKGYRKYFIRRVNGDIMLTTSDLVRLRKGQVLRVVGQLK